MWERLGGDVDVLVVGGGITGSGIARDAVRRGLSVALVEMNDLAYGTSSRSSKLVHGGLRYLEQGELAMVFEIKPDAFCDPNASGLMIVRVRDIWIVAGCWLLVA